MIIFIGSKYEFNLLSLSAEATAQGKDCILFQTSPKDPDWKVSASSASTPFLEHIATGKKVHSSEVTGIWCRSADFPHFYRPEIDEIEISAKTYFAAEWSCTISGFFSQLRGKWSNRPQIIKTSGNRILQMYAAPAFGLCVPNWIVTCSQLELADFVRTNKGKAFITKAINEGSPDECGEITPNTVKIKNPIEDLISDVGKLPLLVQVAIITSKIVRAYVIGESVFAAEGLVDLNDEIYLDSRLDLSDIKKYPYIQHKLPEKIVESLVCLAKSLGLLYGAADLLLDQDGCYWFLEINPSGQWAWIEQQTGQPLTSEIIKLLS